MARKSNQNTPGCLGAMSLYLLLIVAIGLILKHYAGS